MQPFRYHAFICNQEKPEGIPSCTAHGSKLVIDLFRKEVAAQGLTDKVQITACGSFGLCEWGPNMIVYPDGIWYCGVGEKDVAEIVREHFQNDRPVKRLIKENADQVRAEIKSNAALHYAAMEAQEKAGMLPFDLQGRIRSFMASRAILTAVELDVFSQVGNGASAAEVAKKIDTNPRATEKLLNALVALDLLTKKAERFQNTPVASRFLSADGKDDSRAAIMHSVNLWKRWTTLSDCVRKGTSVTFEPMEERDDGWTVSFIAAMHKNASFRARQIVATIGVDGVKRVLDVGGGSGAYSIAFVQAGDDIHSDIFDLSTVVPLARKYAAAAGVSERVGFKVGDMQKDDLGNGYDLVLLSAICHMFSVEENELLLRKCYKALNPGGRIAIQDFILEPDKTSPQTAALFALNMLVGTPGGSAYSEGDYFAWLKAIGFGNLERKRLPGPTGLIIGRRP
jgi:(2Fe-2S) ferredoxin/2-polyprenyl-3-methyl-5-hydroxy-6-metoxy-1,4-benzoquinol methylase